MTQACEAGGLAALDEPAQLGIGAICYIQRVEVSSATAHGRIGINELVCVAGAIGELCRGSSCGGRVLSAEDDAVLVHIVCPDHDGIVHPV
ncbi:hypothetical protein D9M68_423580 [compost metagenome]